MAFIVNENSFFPPAEFSAGSKVASENNLQKQRATILHIRIISGSPLEWVVSVSHLGTLSVIWKHESNF